MEGFVWCLCVIFVVLMVSLGVMVTGSVLMNAWFDLRKKEKNEDAARATKAWEALGSLKNVLNSTKKSDKQD